MTFTVEVLLKGQQDAVVEEVQHDMLDPSSWADDDVREVLRLTLRQFDRVQNPEAEEREVQFRGLSWIVTTGEEGVGDRHRERERCDLRWARLGSTPTG